MKKTKTEKRERVAIRFDFGETTSRLWVTVATQAEAEDLHDKVREVIQHHETWLR